MLKKILLFALICFSLNAFSQAAIDPETGEYRNERTLSIGYTLGIINNLGSFGKAKANSIVFSFEKNRNPRLGWRWPTLITFENGFSSFVSGLNLKVYTNDHAVIRGFVGPEFTLGYTNGGFTSGGTLSGDLGEGNILLDLGIDWNPLPELNISFHPGFGYVFYFNKGTYVGRYNTRVNFSIGFNF